MKETEVTARMVAGINAVERCFAKKRHSGKFGSGDPDIAGVKEGRAFFIETKVIGGELTKLQAIQLEKWRKVDAWTGLAVYDPVKKTLRVIDLNHTETWDQFTGHEGLKELVKTSASCRVQALKDYDYSALMDGIAGAF